MITYEKRTEELKSTKQGEDDIKTRWWRMDEDSIASAIFNVVNRIDVNSRAIWRQSIAYSMLYENITSTLGYMPSLFVPIFSTAPSATTQLSSQLTYNVVKSCIDSACAKLSASKPRVKFITSAGSYDEQQRAEKLTQYLDGIFYAAEVYKHSQMMFRDACIFGTGFLKIFVQDDEIKVERVLPTEIVVDFADGMYGNPRQMHQRKNADRDTLSQMYPEFADKISSATSLPNLAYSSADHVLCIESWHLPSGKNAKDGRHLICIESTVLFDEPYEFDWFPFAQYKWSEAVAGYWGSGLCKELSGIQLELNKLIKNIQMAQEFFCVPHIMIENGSIVNKNKMYDVGIIEYAAGTNPPIFNTPPGMSPEVYEHVETLFKRAYEITGISQLQASSTKPAGLNSGIALREFSDIATERFSIQADKYEQMFISIANKMLELSKKLYIDNPDLQVKAKNKNFLSTIKWKEVQLNEDKFIMQVFPVSSLPRTPAGRFDMVQDLSQAGLLEREQVVELLQIPDLDKFQDLQNASYNFTMNSLEKITKEGLYIKPDSLQNLQEALKLSTATYLKYKNTEDYEPEKLDLLSQYIDEIHSLVEPTPEEQPPTPQEQPQPTGVPEQPPTAGLLPTVPEPQPQ